MRSRLGPAGWAAATCVAVILLICVTPNANRAAPGVSWCLLCGTEAAMSTFLLNVVLYLPLGFALRRATGSFVIAFAAGTALSLGVEAAQLWIPGRYTTLGDFVANSGGAGIGALAGIATRAWLLPEPRAGRVLVAAASCLAGLTVLLPGPLASIALGDGDVYAGWTPRLPSLEVYGGRVLSAEIEGISLPPGRLGDPERLRRSIDGGGTLTLRFEAGPPPASLAPLFRLIVGAWGQGVDAIQLAVQGDDLLIRPPYRARNRGLARPELVLPSALEGVTPGDTVVLRATPAPEGGYTVDVDGRAISVGITAGRGWAFLRRPPGWSQRALTGLDLVWIAILMVPIGWWATSASVLLAGASLPLALLATVPLWTPLVSPGPLTYVAATVGLLLGHGTRRLLRGVGPLRDGSPVGT